jgi:hypothetical protein
MRAPVAVPTLEHEMRTRPVTNPVPFLVLIIALVGCDPGLVEQLGVVRARDLAGTYTGVLQGVTVSNLDDLDDADRRAIVDLDLLHELRIQATSDVTLRMASSVIPPLRAIVLGAGPAAINVDFLTFENPDFTGQGFDFDALNVKQIVFVQYEGEWIVVLQVVRIGVEETVDDFYVYQYVAYPSRVADQMSESEAILYVNAILRLASAAQRS